MFVCLCGGFTAQSTQLGHLEMYICYSGHFLPWIQVVFSVTLDFHNMGETVVLICHQASINSRNYE